MALVWRRATLFDMLADLRFAVRQLLKSPGFAIVAVLSLALGIGANTAIFSLVNEVALKLLPVKAPKELVLFRWLSDSPGMMRSTWGWGGIDPKTNLRTSTSFSKLTFERFRDQSQALADTFAFAPLNSVIVVSDGQSEVIAQSQAVSGNFFSALGVHSSLGRPLGPEDDRLNADPVAVISHNYWGRRFNGDPGVIGKTLSVNQVSFTIVGVTPAGFNSTQQIGESPDLTVPLAWMEKVQPGESDLDQPWFWWLRIMGRLKSGVTIEQAAAELGPIFQQSAREGYAAYPTERIKPGEKAPALPLLRAGPGSQGLTEQRDQMARTVKILSGLVALVLAIACTNVANLLLARGTARQKEIALRIALGASRWRVVRQLLVESLLLSACGAGLGIAFATWGADLLLALRPFGRGMVLDLSLDWRVLGFTASVTLLTGIFFGLAPALRTTRINVNAGLQGSGKQGGSAGPSHLPGMLMVAQVALSLILLVGAGLFLQTLRRLQGLDVGFNRNQLLLFRIDTISGGHDRTRFAVVNERILEAIRRLPGVQRATFSQVAVLSNNSSSSTTVVDGRAAPAGRDTSPNYNRVEMDFFNTFQIPLLAGRAFTERDGVDAPKVAVVNQAMARIYFGEENPVGRTFRMRGLPGDPTIEVVGLVRDARYSDLRSAVPPTVYLPFRQNPTGIGNFAIRTVGDPAALIPSIRKIVQEIDPNLPLANARTQDEQITRLLASEILFARLSSFFGVVALLLACIGLYGLMSYGVLRRTTEIGIRMALGALPANVRWMILRESLGLVGLGVVLGIAGAVAATKAVSNLLYDLSPRDPLVYGATALLLMVVALFACWLPARRAARVDPMIALRSE